MKIKFLPILLILCLLAAGCAESTGNDFSVAADESKNESITSEPETPAPESKPTWDTAPRDIEFVCHGYGGMLDNVCGAFIIRNGDELSQLANLYAYTKENFTEYLSKFDDNFFKEKALLVTQASASSGSHELSIENVSIDEKGILLSVFKRITPEGTDDYQEVIFLAEVEKSEIGDCNVINTEYTERFLYLGGSHSNYDTTPREVDFELRVFSEYLPQCKTELDENGAPDFYSEWSADLLFWNSDLEKAVEYGIETESIDDYADSLDIDYYLDSKISQMIIYVSSDNGNSVFGVSGIRADETGMTVTVTHDIAEGDNGLDRSYHLLLLTIPREQVTGCDNYKIEFADNSGNYAPANQPPEGIEEPRETHKITVTDAETGMPITTARTVNNAKCFNADENGLITAVWEHGEYHSERYKITAYGYEDAHVVCTSNGGEYSVEMTPADYIEYTVKVVDAETGSPVKNAKISLIDINYPRTTPSFYTDENGCAVIKDCGDIGWSLAVVAENYPVSCRFQTQSGKTEYTVKLGRFKSELE